jgi:acetolactate synthase I/II/III large subunit
MSATPWTVGRYVVELLAANGIVTVFGIPGVHTLELYRGIAAAGVRHVLVRHEQNAGFAADGYARASGRPAAACVISGPGARALLERREQQAGLALRNAFHQPDSREHTVEGFEAVGT